MRDLATGTYTAEEIEAQLKAPTATIGCRFDVCDTSGIVLYTLDESDDGIGGVRAATIEMNVDRTIKGSLTLRMTPDDDLVDMLFRRRVNPWFLLGMPDGGTAEFQMGSYVWNKPKRRLTGVGQDEWEITLGDLSHIFDAGGPGRSGYTVAEGTRVVDAVGAVFTSAGFTDTSGIEPSDAVTGEQLVWDLVSEAGRPTTWMRIANDLLAGIGFYSMFIDLDGLPRAARQPDFRSAPADVSYVTDAESITIEAATEQDLARICNRVFVRAKNTAGVFGVAEADANDLYPEHPIAESSIGFYIDTTIEDTTAGTATDLAARAESELAQGLTMFQRASLNTMAWPAHEAFDIVGVQWTDDSEFDDEERFHERRWTFDMFTGQMTHDLRRITGV